MGAEVVEIVERRRRWSTEDKLKVLLDALEPGASIAAVADRHGVSRNLLYTWLRLAREGRMPGLSIGTKAAAAFVPVQVASEPIVRPAVTAPEPPPRQIAPPRRRTSIIEITLANGRVVKVDESIDAEALARIVAVLDRAS
jgi:transposase